MLASGECGLVTSGIKTFTPTGIETNDGEQHEFDLIVLDRMLPDKDGIEICRDLRKKGVKTPILMLTGMGSTEEKVSGLNAGGNLVFLFGGVGNSLLTIVMLILFAIALPPILRWLLIDASWGGATPADCRAAGGACWAVIHEKYRLILFGRYPYAEQWRPLLAMAASIGLVLATCDRRLGWRRLSFLWIVGVAFVALMMWGGALGLTYVETARWGGLPLTLILSLTGIAVAFPLAILLALGRRSTMPLISSLCVGVIELVRGVPLVSMLFMASFLIPLFLPGGVQLNELLRAQAAIAVFSAAYLAEAIRGGLQAVPEGQSSAAQSLGLGYWQTVGLVVLPQAL